MAVASSKFDISSPRFFDGDGLHRLIPSRFSESESVLSNLAEDDAMLADLAFLDGATNDRIQGEQPGLIGISPYELVYGIPNAHIVNAAFLHPNPFGSRFNDAARGAWYAADELETSVAEVTWHKARNLANIIVPGSPGSKPGHETSTCDDWLADFRTELHFLDQGISSASYLEAEPVPQCYATSQRLAYQLLNQQSNGIVYPSVRRAGHTCVACFRPALVYHPRRGDRLEITYTANATGYDHRVHVM